MVDSFSSFSESMTMTARVLIGSVLQTTGALRAVSGTELRGIQPDPSIPPFGPYANTAVYQMTVHGDTSGDTLSFTFSTGTGPACGLLYDRS